MRECSVFSQNFTKKGFDDYWQTFLDFCVIYLKFGKNGISRILNVLLKTTTTKYYVKILSNLWK